MTLEQKQAALRDMITNLDNRGLDEAAEKVEDALNSLTNSALEANYDQALQAAQQAQIDNAIARMNAIAASINSAQTSAQKAVALGESIASMVENILGKSWQAAANAAATALASLAQ